MLSHGRAQESDSVIQHLSVRSGKDSTDTFQKMLEQVNMVSATHAEAIVKKFPTFKSLRDIFQERGQDAISNITVRINFVKTTCDKTDSQLFVGV